MAVMFYEAGDFCNGSIGVRIYTMAAACCGANSMTRVVNRVML
jgi:hypothetical protein